MYAKINKKQNKKYNFLLEYKILISVDGNSPLSLHFFDYDRGVVNLSSYLK
jgi:hypothetical protein